METNQREAFEKWAGIEYRNAATYTARDYKMGLAAWQAARASAPAVEAPRDAVECPNCGSDRFTEDGGCSGATWADGGECGNRATPYVLPTASASRATPQPDNVVEQACVKGCTNPDHQVHPEYGVAGGGDCIVNPQHDLYETEDADAPDCVKDRNGEVVLELCKVCGKAEVELSEPCAPRTYAEGIRMKLLQAVEDAVSLLKNVGESRKIERVVVLTQLEEAKAALVAMIEKEKTK